MHDVKDSIADEINGIGQQNGDVKAEDSAASDASSLHRIEPSGKVNKNKHKKNKHKSKHK